MVLQHRRVREASQWREHETGGLLVNMHNEGASLARSWLGSNSWAGDVVRLGSSGQVLWIQWLEAKSGTWPDPAGF